jgi:protein-disulfide isomerase
MRSMRKERPVLPPHELEQLSRFLAGELSAHEAKLLEQQVRERPELALALARMRRLDQLVARNVEALSAPAKDPALNRVLASTRFPRAWPAIAASVLLMLGLAAHFTKRSPAVSTPPDLHAELGPSILRAEGGAITALPGAQLHSRDQGETSLESGTLLVRGKEIRVESRGVSFIVDGAAIISTEPSGALSRVTSVQDDQGEDMRTKLQRFMQEKSVVAGAALALWVTQGHAEVFTPGRERTIAVVPAGQSWSPPAAPVLVAEREKTPGSTPPETERVRHTVGVPTLSETSASRLTQALRAAAPQLEGCLSYCKGNGCLGTFSAQVSLLTRGGHGRVEAKGMNEVYSVQNPLLASCVLDRLAKLELDTPSADGAEEVTLPFIIQERPATEGGGLKMLTPDVIATKTYVDDATQRKISSVEGIPAKGPANAPVTIIEFGEFECPFCVRVQKTLQELEQRYPGKLRIGFRQMPLPMHPHARLAAIASLAAGAQGKFWEYHDLLYANTQALDRASLERFAQQLGLDLRRFSAALDSGELDSILEADHAEAHRLDIGGAPSFLINGKQLTGARPLESFEAIIDAELGVLFPPTPDGIRSAVRGSMGDIKACYQEWLKAQPGLSGKLVANFTIAPQKSSCCQAGEARVEKVSLGDSGLGHFAMEGCVLSVVKDLKFQAPTDGPVKVSYPFTFRGNE